MKISWKSSYKFIAILFLNNQILKLEKEIAELGTNKLELKHDFQKFFVCFRYGKPMVIDLGEVDRFDLITTQINKVQDGLMDKILDKRILEYDQ